MGPDLSEPADFLTSHKFHDDPDILAAAPDAIGAGPVKPRRRDLFDDETFLKITGRTREEFEEEKEYDDLLRRGARSQEVSQAFAIIRLGFLTLVSGLAVTFWTLAFAVYRGGGVYVLAWGPVLFGGLCIFRGLGLLFSSPPLKDGR
ncbi:hypothetical protein OJF2_06950 [Aquisphaera giovannonii]|uniref:Uncharacterized protein n=1 Tax=Aquisphaera giovannonii TaxID=406548 RepID=A0A5B9VUR1_9BACT|nr:hypothetical protein [Aquisphaera giovannonii]QEH32226.1 hypothetical protein OJF2_06950 [Aquisphaera giovannonii]